MPNAEIPRFFACEYVHIFVKLKDGRKFDWTHWVPNKAVDQLFGIAKDEPYLTGKEYADKLARDYMEEGYLHESGGVERHITPEMIDQVSTTVDKKEFTVQEILLREAHKYDPRDVTVRPQQPRKPTFHQLLAATDGLLHGKTTVNGFFENLRMPKRSEPEADIVLKTTREGYAAPDGTPVNIRPLFRDDMFFMMVDLLRVQKLNSWHRS